MNGCNQVVSDLQIGAGAGDPSFIQNGINNGCWSGSFPYNFTWFSFRAAADGDFAFTLFSTDPMSPTDLDFQIWGPVSTEDSLCLIAKQTQPIRSSFAAGEEPTGLAAIHPILNIPVTDFCEDASGDDFVAPLQVKAGEWYIILVNDWGGGLSNGSVSIDYSGSGSDVLGEPLEEFEVTPDTSICPGNSLQINAVGGQFYQWISTAPISCIYCQNPVVQPDSASSYSVVITSLCKSDTLTVKVDMVPEPEISTSPDTTICGLYPVELVGSSNTPGNFTWFPDSVSSNVFVPVPQLGLHNYEVVFQDVPGCYEMKDSVRIKWLETVPINGFQFLPSDTIFIGTELTISPDSINQNVSYHWGQPIISDSTTIQFTGEEEGTFQVELTATAANGCSLTLTSEIVVLPIRIDFPNAFTPNSDEYNPTFKPVVAGDGIEIASMKIWNRWGKLIYESANQNGWNGEEDGRPVPSDVYIYRVELRLPSGKALIKSGEVTLLR